MKVLQVLAVEHRQALAGIEDERNAGRGELRAHAAIMPSRPSGATMPIATSPRVRHLVQCDCPIAPGWKAVIWLLSRSVVMNACAVCSLVDHRTWSRGMPCSSIHSA